MSKKEWMDKLSAAAKAEILGGILHEFWCGKEESFRKLPKAYRDLILAAARDCSVWCTELKDEDYKNIREWFAENDKRKRRGRAKKSVQ
jgi:TRAP-type C4-dicarboxylate transport system substrate-binding protein